MWLCSIIHLIWSCLLSQKPIWMGDNFRFLKILYVWLQIHILTRVEYYLSELNISYGTQLPFQFNWSTLIIGSVLIMGTLWSVFLVCHNTLHFITHCFLIGASSLKEQEQFALIWIMSRLAVLILRGTPFHGDDGAKFIRLVQMSVPIHTSHSQSRHPSKYPATLTYHCQCIRG